VALIAREVARLLEEAHVGAALDEVLFAAGC
jgi:hypothetical protein